MLRALLTTWETWNAHHTLTRAGAVTDGPAVGALDALRDSVELVSLLSGWQWQAVHAARVEGASWEQIATATGVDVERARGDYSAVIERQAQYLGRDVSAYREVL